MQEKLEIGQIVNTFGIKGEVKVVPFTDDITRFEKELFEFIDTKYPEIPATIAETKIVSEELDPKIRQAVEEFKSQFK